MDRFKTAFRVLKERFTSAPVLTLPDPNLQFIVEWMPQMLESDLAVTVIT